MSDLKALASILGKDVLTEVKDTLREDYESLTDEQKDSLAGNPESLKEHLDMLMQHADMSEAAFNTPKMVETVTRLAEATRSGAINKISWTGRWVEPNNAASKTA